VTQLSPASALAWADSERLGEDDAPPLPQRPRKEMLQTALVGQAGPVFRLNDVDIGAGQFDVESCFAVRQLNVHRWTGS